MQWAILSLIVGSYFCRDLISQIIPDSVRWQLSTQCHSTWTTLRMLTWWQIMLEKHLGNTMMKRYTIDALSLSFLIVLFLRFLFCISNKITWLIFRAPITRSMTFWKWMEVVVVTSSSILPFLLKHVMIRMTFFKQKLWKI